MSYMRHCITHCKNKSVNLIESLQQWVSTGDSMTLKRPQKVLLLTFMRNKHIFQHCTKYVHFLQQFLIIFNYKDFSYIQRGCPLKKNIEIKDVQEWGSVHKRTSSDRKFRGIWSDSRISVFRSHQGLLKQSWPRFMTLLGFHLRFCCSNARTADWLS